MCVEHLIIILRILHLKDDKTEIHGNWLTGQMDKRTQFLFSDQGVSPDCASFMH